MRTLILAAFALSAYGPAFAQSGANTTQAGAGSVESGASLAVEGSVQMASGALVPGAVSVALGGGSVAAGSVAMIGGGASGAVEASASGAHDAIDASFAQPVVVTKTTIVAQPAPTVPYEAQTPPARP